MATAILETPLQAHEAAAALGLKNQTLAKWRMQGRGPSFIKHSKRVVYLPRDIAAFLEANRRNNSAAATR